MILKIVSNLYVTVEMVLKQLISSFDTLLALRWYYSKRSKKFQNSEMQSITYYLLKQVEYDGEVYFFKKKMESSEI